MLKPKQFFAASFDLFFKKQAKITFDSCIIFIDKIGTATRFRLDLMRLEHLWDERVLQTLKSKGCIALSDGFNILINDDKVCFEQLLLERFSYAKARKSLPVFFKEFLEYKTIFDYQNL